MFLYEDRNSLLLTFKDNKPVEDPEVIIRGYKNGAALIVNGEELVSVPNPEEFEDRSNTFVFQRDNELMITFRGALGTSDPEVTIDALEDDNYKLYVNGEAVTLHLVDGTVEVVNTVIEPKEDNTSVTDEPIEDEGPVKDEEPNEVVEE